MDLVWLISLKIILMTCVYVYVYIYIYIYIFTHVPEKVPHSN